jgi:YesN/AraC family two-component response regulator
MEEWKDIKGYEGLYQVSSYGRVRSLSRLVRSPSGHRRIRERFLSDRGIRPYKLISLYRENKIEHMWIHRLVACAFLGDQPNLTVNHIDFNPSNNRLDNLEWCSLAENISHSAKAGRHLENKERSTDDIQKLTMATLIVKMPMTKISEHFNVNSNYVSKMARGERNESFGEIFRLVVEAKKNSFKDYRDEI